MVTAFEPNEHYVDDDGVVHIKLTQGKEALVCQSDYPKVAHYRWFAARDRQTFYARTNIPIPGGKQKTLGMHTLLFKPPDGFMVDHIFGNGCDNRPEKTRIVTNRVNCQNRHHPKSSRYPGVSWAGWAEKWQARIAVDSIQYHLGYFDIEESAAAAYNKAFADVELGIFTPPVIYKTSRFVGISWKSKNNRWIVQIQFEGTQNYIGCFIEETDAKAAYDRAAAQIEAGTFVAKRKKR